MRVNAVNKIVKSPTLVESSGIVRFGEWNGDIAVEKIQSTIEEVKTEKFSTSSSKNVSRTIVPKKKTWLSMICRLFLATAARMSKKKFIRRLTHANRMLSPFRIKWMRETNYFDSNKLNQKKRRRKKNVMYWFRTFHMNEKEASTFARFEMGSQWIIHACEWNEMLCWVHQLTVDIDYAVFFFLASEFR